MFEVDLDQMPFEGFEPGCAFLIINDDEFSVASEPGGLVAVNTENSQGYLTLAGTERLRTALEWAIKNASARIE